MVEQPMMNTSAPVNELEETLKRRIAKAGEDDVVVQQLRRQLAAEKTGKSFGQLYVSGSVKRPA